jgi:hypothetical protein
MHTRLAKIALISMAAFCCAPPVCLAQPSQPQKKQEKSAPAKKTEPASLTGCVDEQDGQYILIHDRTRDPIANLEADGFPTEGFAKHVGHKVTVRGTANPSGTGRPVFKVRDIEALSDSCGPQEH